MTGHVHVSAVDALVVFAYVIIIGAIWRAVAAKLATRDGRAGEIGKAMGLAY